MTGARMREEEKDWSKNKRKTGARMREEEKDWS